MTKVGVVQMNSGPDPDMNLRQLKKTLKGLQLQGAKLVVTPENCLVFGSHSDYRRYAEPLGEGPAADRAVGADPAARDLAACRFDADQPAGRHNDDHGITV